MMERMLELCQSTSDATVRHVPDYGALLIEKARDPVFRKQMKLLQIEARVIFESSVDELANALIKARRPSLLASGAVGGAALARVARGAGMDAKTWRDSATQLMMAAMLNRHNPDWNPNNAATDRANFSDSIILLMQIDLDR